MKTITTQPVTYKQFKKFFFLSFSICLASALQAQPQLVFKSFIQNLSSPVEITNAGDGSGRLFIVEQGGLVKIWKNGNVLAWPFLDLSDIVPQGKEYEGLFSIAFPLDYKTSRMFFVFYTNRNQATVLARYRTSNTNPDLAIANSGVSLFSLSSQVGNGPHFGDLHFGKDGYLYVMMSDLSKPGVLNPFAQNGQSLFGKLLRIDVRVANAPYYSIPSNNPFINVPGVRDEILYLGFRNAWRWSFDRQTGDMWIADVGEDTWEEINFKSAGKPKAANYGWPCYEGDATFNTTDCIGRNNYTFPIFTYPHNSSTGGYSVTGGYVYRGSAYPSLNGYYICADYISGNAWKIKPNGFGGWDVTRQGGVPQGISAFGESEDGELFAVTLSGTIYRVQAVTNAAVSLVGPGREINNTGSSVYPVVTDNNTVILDLKEAYKTMRLIDMSGHELLRKDVANQSGKLIINLPHLNTGVYIVQLVGSNNTRQQKIYITK